MKNLILLFACIAFSNISYSQCGVYPAYTYVIDGNNITLTNTTTSDPDVAIVNFYWQLGDGTTSYDDPFTFMHDDVCSQPNVCIVIQADSLPTPGFEETCIGLTYCSAIDMGLDPLVAEISFDSDEASQTITLTPEVIGGSGAYTYSWNIGGTSYNSDVVVIPFSEEISYSVQLFVEDENGCQDYAYEYVPNPFVDCDLQLNIEVNENYITATPQVLISGLPLVEWEGQLIYNDGDSILTMYASDQFSVYVTEIGTYEWCYQLSADAISYLPTCPTETCTSFEVTSIDTDCNAFFSTDIDGDMVHFTNLSTGNFTETSWNLGAGTIVTSNEFTHSFTPGTYSISLTVSNPETLCSDTYNQIITITDFAHVCGFVFIDENTNGIFDPGEPVPDTLHISLYNTILNQSDGTFDSDIPAGTYCLTITNYPAYIITTPLADPSCDEPTGILLDLEPGEELCPLIIGISVPVATVCGTMFMDANNNETLDTGESLLAFQQIHINFPYAGTYSVFTDVDGHYCVEFPFYTQAEVHAHYTPNPLANVTPDHFISYSISEDATIDFAIYDPADELDLGVALYVNSPPTVGFFVTDHIDVHNYSSVTSAATIMLQYEDQQVAYELNGGVNDAAAHTITWSITIDAYSTQAFYATLLNDPSAMIAGDAVDNIATVTATGADPDIDILNNSSEVGFIAVSSFDPNNKLVQPIGNGDEGRISPGTEWLTYTINFQNTGTSPAVNIIVSDELDEDLNPATFELLAASHNVQAMVYADEVTWTFNEIMLPDSSSDEPGSHGYVVYRISPQPDLSDETTIENTANIYFDFNEAVLTNTTLNTIDYALLTEEILSWNDIKFYPNPVSDNLTLELNEPADLRVSDSQGRIIHSQQLKRNREMIDTSSWSQGVYLFAVTTKSSVSSYRVVKK